MIKIRLRKDMKIGQPMTEKEWEYGFFIEAVKANDDRMYALVVTEHNEFELVEFYMIKPLGLHFKDEDKK